MRSFRKRRALYPRRHPALGGRPAADRPAPGHHAGGGLFPILGSPRLPPRPVALALSRRPSFRPEHGLDVGRPHALPGDHPHALHHRNPGASPRLHAAGRRNLRAGGVCLHHLDSLQHRLAAAVRRPPVRHAAIPPLASRIRQGGD